jgi:hypothetical protein
MTDCVKVALLTPFPWKDAAFPHVVAVVIETVPRECTKVRAFNFLFLRFRKISKSDY